MNLAAPILIFLLLAAPAARLLLLASRTRQAPEIWGGLYFAGTAVGIPLRVVGHGLAKHDPLFAAQLNTWGHAFFAASTCSLVIFTCLVFRREARWIACLSIASIVATTIWVLATGKVSEERSLSVLLTNATRLFPLLWAFFESTRYWRVMQRRQALGLADPVVTNRFLLWALWTGALALLPAMTLFMRLLGRTADLLGVFGGVEFSQLPEVGLLVRINIFKRQFSFP